MASKIYKTRPFESTVSDETYRLIMEPVMGAPMTEETLMSFLERLEVAENYPSYLSPFDIISALRVTSFDDPKFGEIALSVFVKDPDHEFGEILLELWAITMDDVGAAENILKEGIHALLPFLRKKGSLFSRLFSDPFKKRSSEYYSNMVRIVARGFKMNKNLSSEQLNEMFAHEARVDISYLMMNAGFELEWEVDSKNRCIKSLTQTYRFNPTNSINSDIISTPCVDPTMLSYIIEFEPKRLEYLLDNAYYASPELIFLAAKLYLDYSNSDVLPVKMLYWVSRIEDTKLKTDLYSKMPLDELNIIDRIDKDDMLEMLQVLDSENDYSGINIDFLKEMLRELLKSHDSPSIHESITLLCGDLIEKIDR